MADRLTLHAIFKRILGNNNVYFQEPSSDRMHYPCIRYERSTPDIKAADNRNYMFTKHYTVYCISSDPENDIAERIIKELPMCSPGQHYKADNLYHDVISLYF